MTRTRYSRERFLLLRDLRLQLPHSRAFRKQTERAIAQIERELAPGRAKAMEAATRDR